MSPEEFPVAKYTVQLYYYPLQKEKISLKKSSPPIPIASGILIKGRKYYLLTCKHVFNNIKTDDVIILTTSGISVRLPEEVFFVRNGDDNVDLALIHLKGYRLSGLKTRYTFLSKRNIGTGHIFDEDLYYMLFGFINKQTVRHGDEFYVESFGYLTNIKQYRKFEKLGFNYEHNVTMEYTRRKQGDFFDDELRQLGYRDLKGLSGGGIWLSVTAKKPGTFRYILVGIMIEERTDRGFIIGTKIGLIASQLV